MKLGVNIDHICVLRNARAVNDPDILVAMQRAIFAGADQITIHLREDRRHIDENDAKNIVEFSKIPVNIECSVNAEIIDIICDLKPQRATIVPERREELTTEGGLSTSTKGLKEAIKKLKASGIEVSLFIEPSAKEIEKTAELGCDFVELHTGKFANIFLMLNSNLKHTKFSIKELELEKNELKELLYKEIDRLENSAKLAKNLGLSVAAGHGLNYQNTEIIAKIDDICELNIGQSIIARSVICGLEQAIKDMKEILKN